MRLNISAAPSVRDNPWNCISLKSVHKGFICSSRLHSNPLTIPGIRWEGKLSLTKTLVTTPCCVRVAAELRAARNHIQKNTPLILLLRDQSMSGKTPEKPTTPLHGVLGMPGGISEGWLPRFSFTHNGYSQETGLQFIFACYHELTRACHGFCFIFTFWMGNGNSSAPQPSVCVASCPLQWKRPKPQISAFSTKKTPKQNNTTQQKTPRMEEQ